MFLKRAPRDVATWILKGSVLLVYTLIFAELFLRIAAPQSIMPRYVTGSEWGVRTNIPGASYWHITPDVSIEYRINDAGMRDDLNYTLQKPPQTCRIALLGDSYGVGYELNLPDTFAKQVETMLLGRGYRVQVLNFSVSGFGTAESIRTYEGHARPYDPDIVLMQWQVTDYDDNIRSGLYALRNGDLERTSDTFLPGVDLQDRLMEFWAYRLLADNSHLYNFLREQVGWRGKQLLAFLAKETANETARRESPTETVYDVAGYSVNASQIDLSAALLREARRVVENDGAEILVVDIPNRTPDRIYSSSYELMPENLKEQLPPVSPIAAFRDAAQNSNSALFYTNGARHLTPLGARLLAQAIVDRIVTLNAVTRCSNES